MKKKLVVTVLAIVLGVALSLIANDYIVTSKSHKQVSECAAAISGQNCAPSYFGALVSNYGFPLTTSTVMIPDGADTNSDHDPVKRVALAVNAAVYAVIIEAIGLALLKIKHKNKPVVESK